MSDLLTHGVSILLLSLLNCSNTVLVRGVYIDAEEPDGQCVVFPVYYIRLFFQKERLKKQRRILDMEKGAGHNHAQHQHSLRQQLLRHNDKLPIIVPMNKLSSSHLNLSSNHQPHLNQHLISGGNNHGNNNSQTSVSPGDGVEWRTSSKKSLADEEVESLVTGTIIIADDDNRSQTHTMVSAADL